MQKLNLPQVIGCTDKHAIEFTKPCKFSVQRAVRSPVRSIAYNGGGMVSCRLRGTSVSTDNKSQAGGNA